MTHHLLVVEDDHATRQLLNVALAREGYVVHEAADARAALSLFSRELRYDAVLLDLALPGKGGLDLLAEMQRHDGNIGSRVLVVTGLSPRARKNLDPRSVFDVLPKPFDLEELFESVRACVNGGSNGDGALRVPYEPRRQIYGMLDRTISLHRTTLGNVQILDPRDHSLRIIAQRGFGRDFLEHFKSVSAFDGSACGRALRNGSTILIDDVESDPEFAEHRAIAASSGFRSVQSTPLVTSSDRCVGVLSTHFARPGHLRSSQLHQLGQTARRLADVIEKLDPLVKA
ncbi:MAG: response regulator [Thermoanaerobaculia bacterium]